MIQTAARIPALGPGRMLLFLLLLSWSSAFARQSVDYVNPLIGTSASRWDFFASASRPSGMVNLSPDTQLGAFWDSGYIYGQNKVLCFSHIHGWQIYGIPVMPVCGKSATDFDMSANASEFSHADEVVKPGYHKIVLKTYGITAELTSTMRVGMHRYTFPKSDSSQILFYIGDTLMGPVVDSEVKRDNDTELSGYATMGPLLRRPKPFTVYFVAQFSQPFAKFGGWTNHVALPGIVNDVSGTNAGAYVSFSTTAGEQVLMKVAISYVSVENARLNLETELPHWDFDRVVRESHDDWNRWLSRIEVTGGTKNQRVKFYTDLFHSFIGRTAVSDVDGSYCDLTGASPAIRHVQLDERGKPLFLHYNFDSLWGAQWSLSLLWSIAYPEVMDGFCNTMVDMYRDGGLVPRGPSGGNYTYVMIGDEAVPFLAAAYNKGIRHYDANLAYAGLMKNALSGGIRDHAGYESGTNACGGGMKYYIDRGYVPMGIEGHGMHRDGVSMTLEYAYEDWCLAQLAQSLGKDADTQWLLKRSQNYSNVWDGTVGYMRPRLKDGSWYSGFEPVGPDATNGFCEANSAIYTHFVPEDIPGLIRLFGGADNYVSALNHQFELATPDGFVAEPNKHGLKWVDYDNEPSLSMAYMFNLAGAPWLSQKWARAVQQRVYSDVTPQVGYIGDEDEGIMGAFSALMAMGLADVKGGADVKPSYQLAAPIFKTITIHLSTNYYSGETFTIKTANNSAKNIYIESAKLDGHPLEQCSIDHADLVKGGVLELDLGSQPNKQWGRLPPSTLKPEPQYRNAGLYDWDKRHAAVLQRNRTVKPDLVFIGDSITHFWGGEPSNFRGRGEDSWKAMVDKHVATNLGFGFDYIDNAYYRVENGELDGISPRVIVILLGTNNLGHRKDSPEACADNMRAFLDLVEERSPKSKILLLGILPRGDAVLNQKISAANRLYSGLADNQRIYYADLGNVFLLDGATTVPKDLMPDGVHPNAKGYQLLGEQISARLGKIF